MKLLKTYETKQWLVFGLPILAMCLIIACSKKDDDPTPVMTFTGFSPTSGEAGNTTVTLTGTNFSTTASKNTVTFGSVTATVTSAEANQLQVTVPETAETGTISVTTNGTTATSTSEFTVTEPNPVPEITGFDPEEGEWGDQITITGTGFTETDNVVTINGVSAEVLSVEEGEYQFITVEIGDNTRTGKIEVTNSFGESGESENDFTVFHGRWAQVADFEGIKRVLASSFSIDGKGYVGLGVTNGVEEINDFWEYNPAADQWVEKAEFEGVGRHHPISIAIANKGYVGLGNSYDLGFDLDDFWEYDPSINEWTERKSFDGGKRKGAMAFTLGDKGYVGTGFSDLGGGEYEYLKDLWEYSPSDNSWNQKTDFGGVAREDALGFSVGNMGYTVMGNVEGSESTVDLWEYNLEDDIWSKTNTSAPNGLFRFGAVAFSIGDKGYIGLGKDGDYYFSDFWEYDPILDSWSKVADFKGSLRSRATVFVIAGKAYVGLGSGQNDSELKDFWVFDPGN